MPNIPIKEVYTMYLILVSKRASNNEKKKTPKDYAKLNKE